MGVIVAFDPNAFLALFAEFSYLTPAQIVAWNQLAQQYVRNDGGGPVKTAQSQINLLNLMTAHVIKLFAPLPNAAGTGTGGNNPGLVGRISTATEGSVSVGVEMPMTLSSAWFQQTQYGAAFWQAAQPYRSARWVRGPRRNMDPWPGIGGTGSFLW